MRQTVGMLDQDRARVGGDRTHYPDDREGTALLLVVLIAVAMTLLTTPILAGLVTIVPVTVMLAEARSA